MPIRKIADWSFEKPLVLVGFPSQGLVGAICANYLVHTLDMQLVATLDSPRLPPVASVRDGKAVGAIQLFASAQVCGLDHNCAQVVVVVSEVVPPPELMREIAREILEWSRSIGATLVVTLEGASADESDLGNDEDEKEHVYALPNLHAAVDIEKLDAEEFPAGTMGGPSAAFLLEGNGLKMGVLCLVTGAIEGRPDASAAARLVQSADILVPNIKMDAKPLQETAVRLEAAIKEAMEEQKRQVRRMHEDPNIMYR